MPPLTVSRVRFLLGGRHGEFKFLPPPGYAPCCEAVLPREKLKLEAGQDQTAARDLLGPTVTLSQAAFTPTPVDTSQVKRERVYSSPCRGGRDATFFVFYSNFGNYKLVVGQEKKKVKFFILVFFVMNRTHYCELVISFVCV